jgi:hypothetical protein
MWPERELSISSKLVVATALSVISWIATGLFYVYINIRSSQCPGPGMNSCKSAFWGLLAPLLLLLATAVGAGFFAALLALSTALGAGDRVSAAAFGVLFAAVAFATYTLFQDGHPGHPFVTAIYGFPPEVIGLHPIAYIGSAALVVAQPLFVLAYSLTRGRAQRVSAAAGPLLVLAGWIAIRIAG